MTCIDYGIVYPCGNLTYIIMDMLCTSGWRGMSFSQIAYFLKCLFGGLYVFSANDK